MRSLTIIFIKKQKHSTTTTTVAVGPRPLLPARAPTGPGTITGSSGFTNVCIYTRPVSYCPKESTLQRNNQGPAHHPLMIATTSWRNRLWRQPNDFHGIPDDADGTTLMDKPIDADGAKLMPMLMTTTTIMMAAERVGATPEGMP